MNFRDMLDRKMETIERPPVLPLGHYVCQVNAIPETDEFESKDGRQFIKVMFPLMTVSAGDDVDSDELEEYGNPAGQPLRKEFIFSTSDEDKARIAQSEYNMRRFLVDHLGMDESLTLSEAMSSCVGSQCLVQVKHRPDPNDTEVVYAEAGRTAAV